MKRLTYIHWIRKQVRVQWLINTKLGGLHENTASIDSEIRWYGDLLDNLYISMSSVRRSMLMLVEENSI